MSRLEPIEKPRGVVMKLAYAFCRRRMGKVIAPLSVIYSRAPALTRPSFGLAQAVEKKLSLDPGIQLLVQAQTSALNGCGFCLDMKHALAVESELGLEKFEALADYATSPLFDDRERAALDYCREITQQRHVHDEIFERLRKHFSEREIVELTFANAVENFHNTLAVPLGLESDGLCALAQVRHAA